MDGDAMTNASKLLIRARLKRIQLATDQLPYGQLNQPTIEVLMGAQ